MMRPRSIAMFERLFLASLALNAIGFALDYRDIVNGLAREPGLAEHGLGGGFAVSAFAITMAIYLLLWFLIARKGINLARWILAILVAIGLFSLPAALAGPFTATSAIVLAIAALQVAAIVCLFRRDSRAWIGRKKPAGASSPG